MARHALQLVQTHGVTDAHGEHIDARVPRLAGLVDRGPRVVGAAVCDDDQDAIDVGTSAVGRREHRLAHVPGTGHRDRRYVSTTSKISIHVWTECMLEATRGSDSTNTLLLIVERVLQTEK